jgi:NAD-reducing hydrogenase large subunit
VIRMTAGKRVHGTGSVPGGVNKSLSAEERAALLRDDYQMVAWSRDAVAWPRPVRAEPTEYNAFGRFRSAGMCLVRADGALDLYHGGLRARDADGKPLFDHLDYGATGMSSREDVKPWSYMKFPFFKRWATDDGWYRVGPLARVTNCDSIPTPAGRQGARTSSPSTAAAPAGTRRWATTGRA